MEADNKTNPMRLELSRENPAVYSNITRISHTYSDFVIDFSQMLPGKQINDIQTTVVFSPQSAKLFLRALAENLSHYEAKFGEITLPKSPTGLANDLFSRVKPQDTDPSSPQPESGA